MSRDEFMRELEYLLSDISDEEKSDAIGYYEDYFEEAGPENEESVVSELGSPERVAAIIRADLAGHLEQGGEFTERGYEDERFRDPNYQMAERYDLPEKAEDIGTGRTGNENRGRADNNQMRTNRTVKLILWIILIIVAAPVLFGISGGVIGVAAGLLGLLIGAVVFIGAITFALLVAGIGVLIGGIVCMVVHPISGLLLIGLAVLCLGFGFLSLALCGVFYGKFLPFLFRTVVDAISGLINRRRESA